MSYGITGLFVGLLILLLIVGLLLLRASQQTYESTGMPEGEVVYDDSGAWQKQEKPLMSRKYGLVGRPDYLVTVTEKVDGRKQQIVIPVEVKSRTRPPEPYDSHILQLATYCLLIEDQYKQRPPYGYIRYANATIKIPYTESLRNQVLTAAEDIRRARDAQNVARSHNQFGRCRGCGYRDACGDQAL